MSSLRVWMYLQRAACELGAGRRGTTDCRNVRSPMAQERYALDEHAHRGARGTALSRRGYALMMRCISRGRLFTRT